jgi:hypothetical protein
VLGLRLDRLDTVHHLIVQLRQIVALLKALDVLLRELVRVLVEALRMMNVDVGVVVVDDDYSAAVGKLLHVLRVVSWVLLLLLLLVKVVLVQRLLGHAHLVRPDSPMVPRLLLRAIGRRNVRPLTRALFHRVLVHALLRVLKGRALERRCVLGHNLTLDLAGRLVLEGDLAPVVASLQLVLLSRVGGLDLGLAHH